MNHPILSTLRNLIFYSIFWLIIAVLNAFLNLYHLQFDLELALLSSFIFSFIFSVIAIGLWYSVRYSNLEKANFLNRSLHHLIEGIIISGLWVILSYFIIKTIYGDNHRFLPTLSRSLPMEFVIGFIYYMLTVMAYYLLFSIRNLQEKTRNEAELKTLLKDTELSMLKAQINPHFLFNSLNSISSLTISNPEKAQEMIIKLSDFLRQSIHHRDEQLVSLQDELHHSILYLDIEKIRFGNRLHYEISGEEPFLKMLVPGMILQPLFENAIKHGVYESTEEVTILFSCQKVSDGFQMKISNNFDPEIPPRKGNGMGLKNISNRLKLLYQSENLVSIRKTENNFEVNIVIPNRMEI